MLNMVLLGDAENLTYFNKAFGNNYRVIGRNTMDLFKLHLV